MSKNLTLNRALTSELENLILLVTLSIVILISYNHSDSDYRKARYEVQEQADYINGRPITSVKPRPYLGNRPRPLPERPLPDRPYPDSSDSIYDRPDDHVPLSSGISPSAVRRQPPPGQSVGILTGPIPSWEKPALHKNGDPTNFEHCKCSFSFNCKSPGIQFVSDNKPLSTTPRTSHS